MASSRYPASSVALLLLYVLFALLRTVRATPSVAFPFNSQVPTVARVDHLYQFQISGSTFQPISENFTYSLSNQPLWLSIDSTTGTLSGLPSSDDEGASVFTLTASDETGVAHMPCTLIVSADPAPRLEGDLSGQLALSANLSDAQPPLVVILPSTSFRFDFSHASFIDIVPRKLYYYATLQNHTPLPSWLSFDSGNMTFTGMTPELSAYPQSWDIDLIVSDVLGFSGTSASFTVRIAVHDLVFVPEQQDLHVKTGMPVNYTALQQRLFRNNQSIEVSELANATANVPSWLSFDPSTLAIEGITPPDFENDSITISVTDKLGDEATAVLNLIGVNASIFASPIGTIAVYAGRKLDYHFSDSLFTVPNLDIEVYTPSSASWLRFNAPSRDLEGIAPTQTTPTSIEATLIAQGFGIPAQTQHFIVEVEASTTGSAISTTGLATRASPTNSSTAVADQSGAIANLKYRLSGGVIAALTILSIMSAALLVVCLGLCYRQRKLATRQSQISGPVDSRLADVEKLGESSNGALPQRQFQAPAGVNLDPSRLVKRKTRWPPRISRISKASSLGLAGEAAIRGNSEVPDLSDESHVLQTWLRNFFVSDEINRNSPRSSEASLSRRSLQNVSSKHRPKHTITAELEKALSWKEKKKNKHNVQRRIGHGLPADPRTGSVASFSTSSTDVLSMGPLDFPEPPTNSSRVSLTFTPRNEWHSSNKSDTIRLVDTSDIVSDDRPIEVKRQSFIRARASSGQPNPMFAHGSRALSSNGTKESGRSSAALASARSARRAPQKRSIKDGDPRLACLETHVGPFGSGNYKTSATFPRVVSGPRSRVSREHIRIRSPGDSASSLTISDDDLAEQIALPSDQRSWVLPGEASPTPPPLFSRSLRATPLVTAESKWLKDTQDHSSMSRSLPGSSLKTVDRELSTPENKTRQLSRPFELISADNVHRPRSRLVVATASHKPVDAEKIHSSSSWMAGMETATQSGSRRWDDVGISCDEQGQNGPALLIDGSKDQARQGRLQRSDSSGLAFL